MLSIVINFNLPVKVCAFALFKTPFIPRFIVPSTFTQEINLIMIKKYQLSHSLQTCISYIVDKLLSKLFLIALVESQLFANLRTVEKIFLISDM